VLGNEGRGNGLLRSGGGDRIFSAGDDSPRGDRVFDFGTGNPIPVVDTLGDQTSGRASSSVSPSMSDAHGEPNDGFVLSGVNSSMIATADLVGGGNSNWDIGNDILLRQSEGSPSNWLGTATGGFVANDANAAMEVSIDWNVQPGDMWI